MLVDLFQREKTNTLDSGQKATVQTVRYKYGDLGTLPDFFIQENLLCIPLYGTVGDMADTQLCECISSRDLSLP